MSDCRDLEVFIENVDMAKDMKEAAVHIARQAMKKFLFEKNIAAYIKREFDRLYDPHWHCIVGSRFGSYVSYEAKCFIYFYIGEVGVLLFKSVQ